MGESRVSPSAGLGRHLRQWWPLLLGLAAVLTTRLSVIFLSDGTNDILSWQNFGTMIARDGLRRCYEQDHYFNHPPLMGYLAAAIYRLHLATGVRFAVLFKMVPLLGDVLCATTLFYYRQRVSRRALLALLLFALCPLSLMVTGHHGNTDSLCVGLSLLAACLFERRRPLAAGLALACALNIKIIPLFLAVALVLQCRSRRELARFMVGSATALLPFIPLILTIGPTLYGNMVAYKSNPEPWGLWGLFNLLGMQHHAASWMAPIARAYAVAGRYVILASTIGLAVLGRWRRSSPVFVGLAAMTSFLAFTPGFGVQYTIYVVPFLFAVDLGEAMLYSTLAGLFLFFVYLHFWDGSSPWRTIFFGRLPLPACIIGFIAWALLIRGLVSLERGLDRKCRPATTTKVTGQRVFTSTT